MAVLEAVAAAAVKAVAALAVIVVVVVSVPEVVIVLVVALVVLAVDAELDVIARVLKGAVEALAQVVQYQINRRKYERIN